MKGSAAANAAASGTHLYAVVTVGFSELTVLA